MVNKADSIFYNGKIYSMDTENRLFSCFAVKDGRILDTAEGKNEKDFIHRYYDPEYTKINNLNGKTIFPGFSDSHVHAPGLAYDILFNINLYNAKSKDETIKTIEKFIKKHPEKEIYYGRGLNPELFDENEKIKGPKKEHLDALTDKPVIIADFGGNFLWLNTAALKKYNITIETPIPNGGDIPLSENGEDLWGIIRGEARILIPYQSFTTAENIKAAKWFQKKMLSYGYTSIFALRPPGTVEPRTTLFNIFLELEKRGELKMRVHGGKDMDPNGNIDDQIHSIEKNKSKVDSELIRFTTAKFFLDGVVEGEDAYLMEPYLSKSGDNQTNKGKFIWDDEKLIYAFKRTMEAGLQIHCHSIGDGATNKGIAALEKAIELAQIEDHRTIFTHLQLVEDDDIKKMKKSNIIACVQPYWHFKSPAIYNQIEEPLLGERAENEYPLGSLFKNDITVISSSDYPVTSEPNPFHAIQAGVTRNIYDSSYFGLSAITDKNDPVCLLNKEERSSIIDMIKSFTVNSAFSRFQDDKIGSLEKGKFADFIVIDKDPFKIPVLDIGKIKVEKTYFEGNLVFDSSVIDI